MSATSNVVFLVQANEDLFLKKDIEQATPPLNNSDHQSKLPSVESGLAHDKCDTPLSKEITPVQQEELKPHRPTNFFDR